MKTVKIDEKIDVLFFERPVSDLKRYAFKIAKFLKEIDCVLYSLSPIIANIMGTIIAVKRYKLRLLRLKMQDIIDALRNIVHVFKWEL